MYEEKHFSNVTYRYMKFGVTVHLHSSLCKFLGVFAQTRITHFRHVHLRFVLARSERK